MHRVLVARLLHVLAMIDSPGDDDSRFAGSRREPPIGGRACDPAAAVRRGGARVHGALGGLLHPGGALRLRRQTRASAPGRGRPRYAPPPAQEREHPAAATLGTLVILSWMRGLLVRWSAWGEFLPE